MSASAPLVMPATVPADRRWAAGSLAWWIEDEEDEEEEESAEMGVGEKTVAFRKEESAIPGSGRLRQPASRAVRSMMIKGVSKTGRV